MMQLNCEYFKMQSEDISRQYVHVFMDQRNADSKRQIFLWLQM